MANTGTDQVYDKTKLNSLSTHKERGHYDKECESNLVLVINSNLSIRPLYQLLFAKPKSCMLHLWMMMECLSVYP